MGSEHVSRGDGSRRQQVRRIFLEAAELTEAQRGTRLDELCGRDAALRAEVERLLAADRDAGGFLGSPTASGIETGASSTMGLPLSERAGTVIGPYKLLQSIGEGGFGAVFLAEQSVPVRRRVALKIIKLGMDTRQVIARFEAERQALALMDHPNIARVLDAGATETGRPYFVMEYVTGDSITAFAAAHKLSVPERLALFTQVCNAVQHAHQKGIIHRDLKPGNVLVSMSDGKPFAKVIDFGIAKATGAVGALTDKTLFTEHRQLIGTPEYMSPEQAEGSPDIDTRTDVYALGVLLYELLTGLTPFDGKRLRSAAWGEMQRIIREEEPPAPSLRLERTLRFAVEMDRRGDVVPKELAGELDWIVMKAMEKDRARRYESPNQLAADVQRHLTGEAVVAAPMSAGYRVRKFVRRNRGVVGAVGAVMLALAAGGSVALWQWNVARQANRDLRSQNRIAVGALEKVAHDGTDGIDALNAGLPLFPEIRGEPGFEFAPSWSQVEGGAQSSKFVPMKREKATGRLMQLDENQLLPALADMSVKLVQHALNTHNSLREEVKKAELAEATLTLAKYQSGVGDREVTRTEMARVVAIRERHLGDDDLATLNAMCRMAYVVLQGDEQSRAFDEVEKRIVRRGYRLDSEMAFLVAAKGVRCVDELDFAAERRWRVVLANCLVPLFESEGAAGMSKLVGDLWALGGLWFHGGLKLSGNPGDPANWTLESVKRVAKDLALLDPGDVLMGAAMACTYDFPTNYTSPAARAKRVADASPRWDAIEQAASALVGTPSEPGALSAIAMVRRAKGEYASAIDLAGRAAAARERMRRPATILDVTTVAMAAQAMGDEQGAKRGLAEAEEIAAKAPLDGLWDVNGMLRMARKAIEPNPTTEEQLAEQTRKTRLAESEAAFNSYVDGDMPTDKQLELPEATLREIVRTLNEVVGEADPRAIRAAWVLGVREFLFTNDEEGLDLMRKALTQHEQLVNGVDELSITMYSATAAAEIMSGNLDRGEALYGKLGRAMDRFEPAMLKEFRTRGGPFGVHYFGGPLSLPWSSTEVIDAEEVFRRVKKELAELHGDHLGEWAATKLVQWDWLCDDGSASRSGTLQSLRLLRNVQAAAQLEPSDPKNQAALALAHFRAGSMADGLAAIRNASALRRQKGDPQSPFDLVVLAMIRVKLSDADEVARNAAEAVDGRVMTPAEHLAASRDALARAHAIIDAPGAAGEAWRHDAVAKSLLDKADQLFKQ